MPRMLSFLSGGHCDMARRFVSIWFRHLVADWLIRRQPDLKEVPFVLCQSERGRLTVAVTSAVAERAGIRPGMRSKMMVWI